MGVSFYFHRKMKAWFHRKRTKLSTAVKLTRWEEDYQLIENEGLFQEYLEMGTHWQFNNSTGLFFTFIRKENHFF